MNVVVLYESMTGNTRRAAELVGGAAKLAGCEVSVRSVRAIDLHELAQADLIFLGTWVDGLILFGHRPGGGRALRAIPVLDRKQVAIFMTYAVHAGGALAKFGRLVRGLGGELVAAQLFKRSQLSAGADAEVGDFVADALLGRAGLTRVEAEPAPEANATVTGRVEFGWFIPTYGDSTTVGDPATLVAPSAELFTRVARAAEDAGFDYALVPVATECWEAWITTAMLAARTTRLTMLCAARPGLIAPTVMAKMVATFDQLSGGRVSVNLIAGGSAPELAADGAFYDHDQRYEVMEETVALMKAAWAARAPFDWEGRHFRVQRADVRPKPLQQPHPPFYIGGISPAAIEVGARHADVYLYWGNTVDQIRSDISQVRRRAEAHGRADRLRHGMRFQVLVRETEAQAWRDAEALIARAGDRARASRLRRMGAESHADARMRQLSVEAADDGWRIAPHLWAGITTVRHGAGVMIVGDPDQVADTIRSYVELGCTSFCLSGYPHDEEARRFGELVLPAFR